MCGDKCVSVNDKEKAVSLYPSQAESCGVFESATQVSVGNKCVSVDDKEKAVSLYPCQAESC